MYFFPMIAYCFFYIFFQKYYNLSFHLIQCSESDGRSATFDSATPQTIQSMEFSRPEYWSGQPFPSPGDLPNLGIESRSLALQAYSLPAEPQGKPKNTEVCSLSLLQWIFMTQELNQGLQYCRQILYHLSYQCSTLSLLCEQDEVKFIFCVCVDICLIQHHMLKRLSFPHGITLASL